MACLVVVERIPQWIEPKLLQHRAGSLSSRTRRWGVRQRTGHGRVAPFVPILSRNCRLLGGCGWRYAGRRRRRGRDFTRHHRRRGRAGQAAWDTKAVPTFSDTFAIVRQQLWPVTIAWMSPDEADTVKIPVSLRNRLPDARAYAA